MYGWISVFFDLCFFYLHWNWTHSLIENTVSVKWNVYISSAGWNKSMYTVSTSLPLLLCSNVHFQKMFLDLKNIHAAAACFENVSTPPFVTIVYLLKYRLYRQYWVEVFLQQKEAKVPLNLNCRWDEQMDINLHVQCASQNVSQNRCHRSELSRKAKFKQIELF